MPLPTGFLPNCGLPNAPFCAPMPGIYKEMPSQKSIRRCLDTRSDNRNLVPHINACILKLVAYLLRWPSDSDTRSATTFICFLDFVVAFEGIFAASPGDGALGRVGDATVPRFAIRGSVCCWG